ncbi:uncharacterized protein [Procambarus clarkii]|uniref:uncharacterized protein isoform X6 n=1 Tax=Procambarus clarkii TaxID=6728 RepID=UPI003743790C
MASGCLPPHMFVLAQQLSPEHVSSPSHMFTSHNTPVCHHKDCKLCHLSSYKFPDKRSAWLIIAADYQVKQSRRYFSQQERCFQCRQFGHRKEDCPRVPHCHLCSQTDHITRFTCPENCCFRCGGTFHYFCTETSASVTCSLCGYRGHRPELCPDLWRRFHLTTSGTALRTPDNYETRLPNERFCFNCGRRGHFGHDCPVKFQNCSYSQVPQSVISYSAPVISTNVSAVSNTEGTQAVKGACMISIKKRQVRRVLGRKRVTLQEIQRRSGATVRIIRNDNGAEVRMYGSKKGRSAAQDMIEVLLKRKNVQGLEDFVVHVARINAALKPQKKSEIELSSQSLNEYSRTLSMKWHKKYLRQLGKNKLKIIKQLSKDINRLNCTKDDLNSSVRQLLNFKSSLDRKCVSRIMVRKILSSLRDVSIAVIGNAKYGPGQNLHDKLQQLLKDVQASSSNEIPEEMCSHIAHALQPVFSPALESIDELLQYTQLYQHSLQTNQKNKRKNTKQNKGVKKVKLGKSERGNVHQGNVPEGITGQNEEGIMLTKIKTNKGKNMAKKKRLTGRAPENCSPGNQEEEEEGNINIITEQSAEEEGKEKTTKQNSPKQTIKGAAKPLKVKKKTPKKNMGGQAKKKSNVKVNKGEKTMMNNATKQNGRTRASKNCSPGNQEEVEGNINKIIELRTGEEGKEKITKQNSPKQTIKGAAKPLKVKKKTPKKNMGGKAKKKSNVKQIEGEKTMMNNATKQNGRTRKVNKNGLSAPEEVTGNAPVEMTGNAPVEMTGNAPVEMTGNAPVKMTGNAPVEMTDNAPVEMTSNAPMINQSRGNAAGAPKKKRKKCMCRKLGQQNDDAAMISIEKKQVVRVVGHNGATIEEIQRHSGATVQSIPNNNGAENDDAAMILIEKKQVGRVVGCNGATIQEIQRYSGATVQSIRNDNGPKNDDAAMISIEKKQVVRVVGHNGATIEEIQRHSGATVQSIPNNNGTENDDAAMISIEKKQVVRVVGHNGATIEEIQRHSGATVQSIPNNNGTENDDAAMISIEKKQVVRVVGHNGATIEEIQRHSGATVQSIPNNNGAENDDAAMISIEKKQVVRVVGHNGATIEEIQRHSGATVQSIPNNNGAENDNASMISIEKKQVGRVVGHNGATIQEIQRHSGATVQSIPNNNGAENDDAAMISIEKKQVVRVVGHNGATIEEIQRHSGATVQSIPNNNGAENGVHMISIKSKQIGRVVGRKGAVIQEIRRRSGATVEIIPSYRGPKVRMCGSKEECSAAQDIIEVLLGRKNNDDAAMISIEKKQVGRVVGCNGAIIQEIQRHSGAIVQIIRNDKGAEVRMCGSKEECSAAQDIIEVLLGRKKNADARIISIEKKQIRSVMGRDGHTIQEIQRRSGATVQIIRKKKGAEVRLYGSKEGRSAAQDMIEVLLKRRTVQELQDFLMHIIRIPDFSKLRNKTNKAGFLPLSVNAYNQILSRSRKWYNKYFRKFCSRKKMVIRNQLRRDIRRLSFINGNIDSPLRHLIKFKSFLDRRCIPKEGKIRSSLRQVSIVVIGKAEYGPGRNIHEKIQQMFKDVEATSGNVIPEEMCSHIVDVLQPVFAPVLESLDMLLQYAQHYQQSAFGKELARPNDNQRNISQNEGVEKVKLGKNERGNVHQGNVPEGITGQNEEGIMLTKIKTDKGKNMAKKKRLTGRAPENCSPGNQEEEREGNINIITEQSAEEEGKEKTTTEQNSPKQTIKGAAKPVKGKKKTPKKNMGGQAKKKSNVKQIEGEKTMMNNATKQNGRTRKENKNGLSAPEEVTGNVPVEMTGNAPMEMTDNAPVEMTGNAPMEMTGNVPKEMTGNAPMEMTDNVPKEMTGNAPMEMTGNVPVEMTGNAPMEMTGNVPKEMTGNAPKEMTGNVPVEITGNAPVEMTGNVPVEMTGNAPVEMTGNVPVEMTGNAPVEMTGNAPVEMTDNAHVEMTGNAPKEMTGNAPEEMTGNAPEEMTGNAPEEMTDTVPMEMTDNAPTINQSRGNAAGAQKKKRKKCMCWKLGQQMCKKCLRKRKVSHVYNRIPRWSRIWHNKYIQKL